MLSRIGNASEPEVHLIPSPTRIRELLREYKILLILASAAALAELAYAVLNLSGMPMYVGKTLGRLSQIGFILGAFLGAEALSRPMLGALGDRIGRKPLMLAGPAITAVTAYLTILYRGPYVLPYLMGLRVLDGLGSSALWMNAFAAIADVVGENRRSAAMSVLNMTYMGGMSMGFLLGGVVNDHFHSLLASFYLASGLFVLAFLVLLIFFPWTPKSAQHSDVLAHEAPVDFKPSHILRSFREVPDMVVMAVVTFVGMGMLTPIVKYYAFDHLGLSETAFGIVVAPIAACMGLFAVPLGHLGDRYGKTTAVCWGLFAAAVAMWVLALYKILILVALAGIVIGLGFTVAFPAWNALVLSCTSARRRGEVLGAVGLAQGLAAWLGTLVGPLIYNSDALSFPRLGIVNYNVPFWLSAISISGGTVICFTWVCAKRAGSAVEERVTCGHRRVVVAAAIIGFLALAGWIGYRYTMPIPPDRVAWGWIQQLARNKPEKALKYALPEAPGWNGRQASFTKAAGYHHWVYQEKASYTVYRPNYLSDQRAEVGVKFIFPGNEPEPIYQTITLCRRAEGEEWRVCGVGPADNEVAPGLTHLGKRAAGLDAPSNEFEATVYEVHLRGL